MKGRLFRSMRRRRQPMPLWRGIIAAVVIAGVQQLITQFFRMRRMREVPTA